MANNESETLVRPPKAIVLVLGDIGHSPRMCNHASSLASHGVEVELVGYAGSQPHLEILNNDLIRLVHLPTPPKCLNHATVPRALQLFMKLLFVFFALFWTLLFRTSFRVAIILVQNPPGIPAMFICYLVSRLKSATFIVDWHNYSYTMIAQSFSNSRANDFRTRFVSTIKELIVKAEGFSGRHSDHNICVSNAMRQDLKERWDIKAITLYDRPPRWNFISMNHKERHEFFHRLFQTSSFSDYANTIDRLSDSQESTLFTRLDTNGNVELRSDRPLILVSSTSWTEDEDFGILLSALKEYDKDAELKNSSTAKQILPKLFVVITGKGPQKEHYLERISQMHLKHVTIVTAWLAAEDYPRLLASADLGVSLHTSTSGLDLPMKIVDMFGCSLPVLAKRFHAIEEQVSEGMDGRIFENSVHLRQILIELATGFPNSQDLNNLKRNMSTKHQPDWHEQWNALLYQLIDPIIEHSKLEQSRWERFR